MIDLQSESQDPHKYNRCTNGTGAFRAAVLGAPRTTLHIAGQPPVALLHYLSFKDMMEFEVFFTNKA